MNKQHSKEVYGSSTTVMQRLFCFLFVFLLTPLFINADPQSFYIPAGLTIQDGNTVRGYCLEYTKDELNSENIEQLSSITGNVLVEFKDGSTREMFFDDLKREEMIQITVNNSSTQFVRVTLDERIERITVSEGGIVMGRENTSPRERELIDNNVQEIIRLENSGASHQYIQNTVWKKKFPEKVDDTIEKITTITFYPEPGKELMSVYDDSASVIFTYLDLELRLDALLREAAANEKRVFDLITHWHNDHIDSRDFERRLANGLGNPLFLPIPMYSRTMQSASFELLRNSIEFNRNFFSVYNYICELSPGKMFLQGPEVICSIGDFLYSEYRFDDIQVGMFRYIDPKNVNMDGIMYKITYKNVEYMFFGDFDDSAALDKLVTVSEENQQKRLAILEEYYELESRLIDNDDEEIKLRRAKLYEELRTLPTIQADIVKHPHHAHSYEEKDREIINRLYKAIDPHFILYQAHQSQDLVKFSQFIGGMDHGNKFINSAIFSVQIFSLHNSAADWHEIKEV